MMHVRDEASYITALRQLDRNGVTLQALFEAISTIPELERFRTPDVSRQHLRWMATSSWSHIQFAAMRLNELFAGLALEHDDDYVLALIGGVDGGSREQWLRQDDDLRETLVWRMFEVEGGGEVSLANVDKFCVRGEEWSTAFVLLAQEGLLPRDRLRRAALTSLGRDFSAYRAGWFSRFYTALAPTREEVAADQALLLPLLGSPIPATVTFAAKHLAGLGKPGLLDDAGFTAVAGLGFGGTKATGVLLLKTLAGVLDRGAVPRADALDQAAAGLGHAHADVQRAAVDLLLAHDAADRVRDSFGLLPPALAVEYAALGDPAVIEPPTEAPSEAAPGAPAARPVARWSDDEALEGIATLLETLDDAVAFEQALAWLAATPDAAGVLAPLRKRALAKAHRPRDYVPGLVVAALDADAAFLPDHYATSTQPDGTTTRTDRLLWTEEDRCVLPSLVTRMREVVEIVQGHHPRRPLLATPSDTHGWVRPADLVARLAAGPTPLPADLTAALLRLHPEGRAEALAALPDSDGEGRRIVAFALGAPWTDPDGALADSPLRSGWAAASLTRGGDPLPALVAAGLDRPGLGRPADLHVRWERHENTYVEYGKQRTRVWFSPHSEAGPSEDWSAEHPADVPSRWLRHTADEPAPFTVTELAFVTPGSTSVVDAWGVTMLYAASQETLRQGEDQVLDALTWLPAPWTTTTAQVLALGLSGQRPEVRAHAAEVFAVSVPLRLGPADFAAGMAACVGSCVLARWAGSLRDAAAVGEHPAAAVRAVLTALLPRLDRRATGVHTLLALLYDESLRVGAAVDDPTLRAWLGDFTGSSAAAKAAKALLAAR